MSDDSEENVHYISDQDSTDDKPQIESIINITAKKYKNESYVVKILLSQHYRDFRNKFFEEIRRTHKSIYQDIKKEIRNYLNPYRIFIEEKKEVPKEVKELYELLKGYYKERNFNNTFFINYFKDLAEAHKNKSRIVSMLPKDEIETLNDIERKVTIIKNLRHYLNTNVSDRIQTNFEQKKGMFESDYFTMMYKYLVIDEEEFSNMGEKELFEYLSNKRNSYKLRRPINDFNVFNYVPILCKGYCQKEADFFIDKFNKSISNHVDQTNCERCKNIKEELSTINSQIKSIYLKTCIFSHNINEIMFHPLMFFSLSVHLPFYQKEFSKKPIQEIFKIVQENTIPKRFHNLRHYEIQNIYNPADVGMKKIYNLLVEYARNKGIYGNCCYLSEYKTTPCPIEFKPNNNDYYVHMKKCPYYHSNLEKRRITKNMDNEICKEVIKDGKWIVNDDEKINCNKKDYCNKFHTRNELFFDEKNYRKLYPCTEPYYCEKGDLCPRKHPFDIKIEEIYLPLENKNDLEKELKQLINKNERMKRKLEYFSRTMCKSCLNYIDGQHNRNIYIFNNCNHVICSNCYDYYHSCPLCGFNEDDDDYDDKKNTKALLIKLGEKKIEENEETKDKKKDKNKNKNKKKKEEEEEEDSQSEEEEEEDKEEEEEEEEENDDKKNKKKSNKKEKTQNENKDESESSNDYSNSDEDLKDDNNNDEDLKSDCSLGEVIFPEDDIDLSKSSVNTKKGNDYNRTNKGRKRGKGTQNNNEDRRNNNNSYYSYQYDNNDRSYNYNRGRGRGRGRGGYRGGRGGQRGRGRGVYNNNNYNNSFNTDYYGREKDNSYINDDSSEFSNKRGGKGTKRGSTRGGKKYYDDRNNNKSKYEDNSEKSQSNSESEEDENKNDRSDYQNECSMRVDYNSRRGARGKGKVVRGGRGGTVRGRGAKKTPKREEDSDKDSDDSNDNNNKNSFDNSKKSKNNNTYEEESD